MTRIALITGVTGQDGAYLARFLLQQGYRVFGGQRRSSGGGDRRLHELRVAEAIEYVDFDLAELTNIMRALDRVKPDEIYNLAAQSFVALSFEQPLYTSDADAMGPLRILEAIRHTMSSVRFYQASTSEMFGLAQQVPQNETTPFYPIGGVWTRGVDELVQAMGLAGISKSEVSKLCEDMDERVNAFLERWMEG